MNAPVPFPLPKAPDAVQQKVLRAAAEGKVAWLDGAAVPAGLIRSLLFRGVADSGRLTPLGLRLSNGRIEGKLDLSDLGSAEAPAPPLVLWHMKKEEGRPGLDLDLTGATLAALDLRQTRLDRIAAADLTLRRRLDMSGCRSGADAAWTFDGASVGGDVFLDGAEVAGEVRFVGAEIGGGFYLRQRAKLTGEGSAALNLDGARVGGDVFLDGAEVAGEVRFVGAEIGGQLGGDERTTIRNRHGVALNCNAATVRSGVLLRRVRVRGGVNFVEAEVGRGFDLSGSALHAAAADKDGRPDGALGALGLKVGGDLLFGDVSDDTEPNGPIRCAGPLRLDRARIEGAVVLNGALLLPSRRGRGGRGPERRPRSAPDPEELVLSLEQAHVGARIEVRGLHPKSRGVVDLRGAQTGLLDDAGGAGWGEPCHWSQPPVGPGDRLRGIQLRLDGFTYSRVPDFEDEARLRPPALLLRLRRGWKRLHTAPSILRRALADPARWWAALLARVPRTATERTLAEWKSKLWGGTHRPRAAATSPRDRRYAFLMRQFPGVRPVPNDFSPQPFEHLAALLRAAGHPQEADWFARQKRDFRLRCRVDGLAGRLWSRFTGLAFGHYYSPGRAFSTLGLGILLGAGLLVAANDRGMLVERRQKVELAANQAGVGGGAAAQGKPCWDATGFTAARLPGLGLPVPHPWVAADAGMVALDTMLPVVELRQDDRCEVNEDAADHEMWSVLLALYSAFGLVVLPMFLATVTGLLRRD